MRDSSTGIVPNSNPNSANEAANAQISGATPETGGALPDSTSGSAESAKRSENAARLIDFFSSPEFEQWAENFPTLEDEIRAEEEGFDLDGWETMYGLNEALRDFYGAPEPKVEYLNDAEVIGDFEDELLDREIEFGSARGAREFKWPSRSMTVEKFIEQMSVHAVGKKDGRAILQGKAIEGQRKANSIEFLDLLILDIDTGQPIDALVDRIRELGLAAVVYSSHSHLKDVSSVGKDALMKWAGIDSPDEINAGKIRAFLLDEKGYEPSILKDVEYLGTDHTANGVVCRLRHAPMPKFKVVLFLKKRFVIAREAPTQREAITKWKELYAGAAHLLGAHYDRSCVDPSRLQYMPRRPNKNDPFVLKIFGGEPIDLSTVERKPVLSKTKKDPFREAGQRASGQVFATPGLLKFMAQHAHVFEAADFFQEHDPDGVRAEVSLGLEVRCPNDDMHSNAGDENDRACLVTNGTENEQESGFIWKCQHHSCQEHDRAKLLDMFLQQHELGIDDCLKHCAEIAGDVIQQRERLSIYHDQEKRTVLLAKVHTDIGALEVGQLGKAQAIIDDMALLGLADLEALELLGDINRAVKDPNDRRVSHLSTLKDAYKNAVNEIVHLDRQRRADEQDNALSEVLDKYNQEFAVASAGQDVRVVRLPKKLTDKFDLLRKQAFIDLEAPNKIEVMSSGDESDLIEPAKYWLTWQERKTYPGGLVFEPSKKCPDGALNIWRGFSVEGVEGDWSLLRGHLYRTLCHENPYWFAYMMSWLADLVQNPGGERHGVAIVVKGKKGTGKTKPASWVSDVSAYGTDL